MSKNSEKVKRWRQNTKQRIVDSMGGKCQVCGYDKCNEAMDLHHLDPTKKEFGLGKIRANCISWESIVVEIRKCVLLCNRCHSELHYGLVQLPEIFDRYNEDYTDYKSKQKGDMFDECPVCHDKKLVHRKTCSRKCAAVYKNRVDWNNVDLKSMIESGKTFTGIADELNVTAATVKKRCVKLGLV